MVGSEPSIYLHIYDDDEDYYEEEQEEE